MTYPGCEHKVVSFVKLHDGGGEGNSTNPTVPSSNERMTESTIVCNMYKRQHLQIYNYIIYIYIQTAVVMTSACGCTAVIPDEVISS